MKLSSKTIFLSALCSTMGAIGITLFAYTHIANAESPIVAQLISDRDGDADHDDDDDLEEDTPIAPDALAASLSPEEAANIALTVATGDIQEIELENEAGQLVYEVELGTTEVIIDAQTGDVLSEEAEDDEDDEDDDD